MTAIVYDGKTLAADRRLMNRQYNICGQAKKLFKWKKGWWGLAGTTADDEIFRRWLENRSIKGPVSKGFEAIFSENGKVYAVDKSLIATPAVVPEAAGSAGEQCEILCRVGYTAEESIKTVMKWNVSIGGKVDVVEI